MNYSITQHLLDSLPVLIAYIGKDQQYQFANRQYLNWLGLKEEDVIGKSIVEVFGADRYAAVKSHVDMALLGQNVSYELIMPSKSGARTFFARYIPFIGDNGEVEGFSVMSEDITEKKLAEIGKNNLVTKLQKSTDDIKTLQGVIPICSYCHSIRGDEGAWDKLEAYIIKHSHVEFSHGVCPKCLKKARAEAGLEKN